MQRYIRYFLPCILCGMLFFACIRFVRLATISAVRAFSCESWPSLKTVKKDILRLCKVSVYGQSYLRGVDEFASRLVTNRPCARQVILGREGWLFYNPDTDGDPLGDYRGEIRYDHGTLESCRQGLERIAKWLSERNILLYVMVLPNKENVYPEYMPFSIPRYSCVTRTDVLVDYLREKSTIRVIYPKSELLEAKQMCSVYYPSDTHWNYIGGYVGVHELMKEMGRAHKSLKDREVLKMDKGHEGDLIRLGNLKEYRVDDELYVRGMPMSARRSSKWNRFNANENMRAKTGDSVFVYGDSFRMAMIPTLLEEFRWVYDDHRSNYENFLSTIKRTNPKVVVLEWVERYSGRMGDDISHMLGTVN